MRDSCSIHLYLAVWSIWSQDSVMRILLVEDEAKVANFVRKGLIAERFAVDVAEDGQTGLELAQTYDYDLLILDLMLPKLDGSQILSRLRKKDSKVPVIMLTAKDSLQDKVAN